MKTNLHFIFPRLIGATLIVGLASMILSVLFKLMLGVLLIGGVVVLAKRIAGRRNPGLGSGPYGRFAGAGYGPMPGNSQWGSPITATYNDAQKQTIVPIN